MILRIVDELVYFCAMNISVIKYNLLFSRPAGTSRGVLNNKDTWFVKVFDENNPQEFGLGEINMFKGLSYDDRPAFYEMLQWLQANPSESIENLHHQFIDFPSIRFGIETALIDFENQKNRILFPSAFTRGEEGIPINGLIWMGNAQSMQEQIEQKIKQGFRCLKMKIGAIDFETEIAILKSIREMFSASELELRVDANGAFHPNDALTKLEQLSRFQLHSIEQPIRQHQLENMRQLCSETPVPIALDEELIGIHNVTDKAQLLDYIQPQYIILKPALTGGFNASLEWIQLAQKRNIGWWITSALESNVGLNAIAQWTFSLGTTQYQGLGTGQLYQNNINSPLQIQQDKLFYNPLVKWETDIALNRNNQNP